jgi:hypothetical protein
LWECIPDGWNVKITNIGVTNQKHELNLGSDSYNLDENQGTISNVKQVYNTKTGALIGKVTKKGDGSWIKVRGNISYWYLNYGTVESQDFIFSSTYHPQFYGHYGKVTSGYLNGSPINIKVDRHKGDFVMYIRTQFSKAVEYYTTDKGSKLEFTIDWSHYPNYEDE